jgi:diadenosine tetraphosphate (Ap4A) HIT family hydrolase
MLETKDCIFCKIVKGELPCYKIYEDDFALVFLDAFPSMLGQVLVIPKTHFGGYAFGLKNNDYSRLMLISKRIARAMDRALRPVKTGMAIIGLEVDHVHIKLFPLVKEGMILKPILDPKPSESEMEELAEKIKNAL